MTEQKAQDPNITSKDKTWAMLSSLLGILFPIIILLMEDKKNRPFLKAHNFQALAYWIVAGIVSAIFSLITYSMSFAGSAFIIVLAAIPAIIWGLKAYNGENVEIPVITEFIKNQGCTDSSITFNVGMNFIVKLPKIPKNNHSHLEEISKMAYYFHRKVKL